MEINVGNLKSEISKLDNLINDYENNFNNLYNQFNHGIDLWNDTASKQFFSNIEIEKNRVLNNINEIKSLKDVYKYIIQNYEELGNKISYNLNEKDNIYNKFNKYLLNLNEIIDLYNRLDLNNIKEKSMFIKEKNKFISIRTNIENIFNEVKNIFYKIENIEFEVKEQLNHINIEILKESL